MKRLFWFIVLVTLVVFIVWHMQKEVLGNIVLRLPGGFFPSEVHIEKNESLRFINLTSKITWPAAGPHPSHVTYPDFDVIGGIAPGKSWVFTFAKEGTYTFHDHFAPEVNGIIVSGSNDLSKVTKQDACTSLSDPLEQASCMEIYFRNVASRMEYRDARALFNDLSVRYQRSCHTFAHDLGKNAYTAYLKNDVLNITEEASSCGYGFWHGFTTAMQAHDGIEASKEFCGSFSNEADNRINCFHGIGIGLIPDPPPAHLWGGFQALIDPALAFCDTVEGDPAYRERCLTGVFHAVTDYMNSRFYGFVFNEDSITKCSEQEPKYQKTCFITLVAALPENTGFDLLRTVAIIEKNAPSELFWDIFFHAAIIFIQAEDSLEEIGYFVERCEAINNNFRSTCISAVINKLYNNGIPGIEYQKAVTFCESGWVYEGEKETCFREVISYASAVYESEKVREACEAVPEDLRPSIEECKVHL